MRRTILQLAARRRPTRAAGFSLIEMLVAMVVVAIFLLGILQVFDAGSQVARVETQLSDLQQSLRASHRHITRFVRMAGRGGLALSLPGQPVWDGPAISVRNSAGPGGGHPFRDIAYAYTDSPKVVDDTDVLTVRGGFTTPVYQIDITSLSSFTLFDEGVPTDNLALADEGVAVISDLTNGIPQDLGPLRNALLAGEPEALILVSPMDERIVGVVEFDPSRSSDGGNTFSVGFKIQNLTYPEYSNLYDSGPGPDPVLPTGLGSAVYLGILEEYRYYVRDPMTGSPPKLSLARLFPGTEIAYKDDVSNLAIDLADNVLDMQVAMAFDSNQGIAWTDRNGGGDIDEDDKVIYESPNGQNDDFLFNTAQDDRTVAPWNGTTTPQPALYYLRLNLLARSQLREVKHQAPLVAGWEDVLGSRIAEWNLLENRMYHRRFQQTIIELRNL